MESYFIVMALIRLTDSLSIVNKPDVISLERKIAYFKQYISGLNHYVYINKRLSIRTLLSSRLRNITQSELQISSV